MGIFQWPVGVGNPLYVYDDANGTNHPAAPNPHTWAEINAAFPLEFPILQSPAGAVFSAGRVQYLCGVDLTFGDLFGGANVTTIQAGMGSAPYADSVDIFSPAGTAGQTRLRFTVAISASQTNMFLGTPIGSGAKMCGKNGCSIIAIGQLRFRCTLGLYGCYINSSNSIQFLNLGSIYQEIAGCHIFCGTSATILGTADGGPLTFWNTTITSASTTTPFSSIQTADGAGVILGCSAPQRFYTSGSPLRKFTKMTLSGAPSITDLNISNGNPNYELTDFEFSDTPGIPRITGLFTGAANFGVHEYWSLDTKVVDSNGNSLVGIPVYATNDVEGTVLDTTTQGDGNIVFTFNPTGKQNVLPVRDWYNNGTGVVTRDRTYTITINGYPSNFFDPNPNYVTRQYKFKWPGIDLYGSSFQANGGSFKPIDDIVMLPNGHPVSNPEWTECNLI